MLWSHKGNTYASDLDRLRTRLGRSGTRSECLAHLGSMEPTNTAEINATVIHGAFEQAWSLRFRASEVDAWLARLEAEDAERHRCGDRR
jgi:hypothetical protein